MVDVFPSPDDVMTAAAERFISAAATATRARGRFTVALSGGSTPERLYRMLAAEPQRERVNWRALEIFWGDERCVPPDDEASNYHMARVALLDHVPIPPSSIHRIHGEADPAVAAADYERVLRTGLGPGRGLDLVLLGLGPDGHTASLFPGSASLLEAERWVLAVEAPIAPRARVTLTPVLIRKSLELLFLVTGADKAPALARALESGNPAEPTRVIGPGAGPIQWLVDSAAAALLRAGGPESA